MGTCRVSPNLRQHVIMSWTWVCFCVRKDLSVDLWARIRSDTSLSLDPTVLDGNLGSWCDNPCREPHFFFPIMTPWWILDASVYGSAMNTSSKLSYFGVPSPVTGSHPETALNPLVLQPGLLPSVIYSTVTIPKTMKSSNSPSNLQCEVHLHH